MVSLEWDFDLTYVCLQVVEHNNINSMKDMRTIWGCGELEWSLQWSGGCPGVFFEELGLGVEDTQGFI